MGQERMGANEEKRIFLLLIAEGMASPPGAGEGARGKKNVCHEGDIIGVS